MSQLIAALQIFLKYEDRPYPTSCDHDLLRVYVDPARVSDEDKATLDTLGFEPHASEEWFISHKFGSA